MSLIGRAGYEKINSTGNQRSLQSSNTPAAGANAVSAQSMQQAEFEVELLTWMAFQQTAEALAGTSQSESTSVDSAMNGLSPLLSSMLPADAGLQGTIPTSPGALSTQSWLDQYQTTEPATTAIPAAQPSVPPSNEIEGAIQTASNEFGVPANLIRSVVEQESGMNPSAVSPSGAMGLMQLMPSTAETLGVTQPFDIVSNINGGTRYLKQLLTQFNGNWSLALAAYNAGPAAVTQYGGIPPFPETQNYVQNVLKNAQH